MNIAFSARGLSIPSGGVHQFIKSLIPALDSQKGDDKLFVFYNNKKFLGLAPDANEIVIEGNNKIIWDFILLPKKLRKLKIDAAIFPKNIVPFFTAAKRYAVMHDMAYFDYKLNAYPMLDTIYMKIMIPLSAKRADGIFAVSEHTKKDILHYTNCDDKKITVTHEAADKIYKPIKNDTVLNHVKKKYDLPDKFIMYVGSLSPRKNVVGLLKAFSRIRTRIPHNLVLTGSKSWKDTKVYETIKELNLTNRINQLGYVEHEDMPAMYNLANCYLYPSLYEGFGLPVLEAMQSGCPVIASNTTSIPEVAGNAALLVNPLDVNQIAEAICTVVNDPEKQNQLIKAGLEQAKKFSWEKCAEIILQTIRLKT
ncbi:MAG: glycosyltransferase family 4 protein [Planctomycetes bacterium]|nr:glycosyltransferase family 4 protein [Planctomycetota bacterium]